MIGSLSAGYRRSIDQPRLIAPKLRLKLGARYSTGHQEIGHAVGTMRIQRLTCQVVIAFALMAILILLAARDKQSTHHQNKVVGLGTLGGPSAYEPDTAHSHQILTKATFAADTLTPIPLLQTASIIPTATSLTPRDGRIERLASGPLFIDTTSRLDEGEHEIEEIDMANGHRSCICVGHPSSACCPE